MTTPEPPAGPAEKLAELLETAPPEDRREITAWLLRQQPSPAVGGSWLPAGAGNLPHSHGEIIERVHRLAGSLPAGTDSQLVTLRLPTDRHAALRDWCAEHGFSMAAVVRGLVERFVEERTA